MSFRGSIGRLTIRDWSEADTRRYYLGINREDIRACLRYAGAVLHTKRVCPLAV